MPDIACSFNPKSQTYSLKQTYPSDVKVMEFADLILAGKKMKQSSK